MRVKRIVLIVLLSLVLFPGLSFGEHRATGLKPHTEEEKMKIREFWPKVKKVYPNRLGLERINAERRKNGLPELGEDAMRPRGSDVLSSLGDEPLPEAEWDAGEPLMEATPSSVDNSELPSFPPIRTQRNYGSCTTFAIVYYQLTHSMGLELGWDNKNEDNTTKFSPKWTFNFLNEGAFHLGTSFYGNYSILEKHGAVKWAEFPFEYDNEYDYREWCLDTNAWRNAIYFRTHPPEIVRDISTAYCFRQLRQLLTNGYVITFSTFIRSYQYTTVSDDPSTAEDDPFVGQEVAFWVDGTEGSHTMTFVGYNDSIWVDINNNGVVDTGEKGALKVANSLGQQRIHVACL